MAEKTKRQICLHSMTFFLMIFVLSSLLIGVYRAEAAVFSNNLRRGDKGTDVLALQKYLNTDPHTQVALYGPGSPGEETEYFGPLTHNAVIRFQEKYKEEILFPLALNQGTGFFGVATRLKLNTLTSSISSNVNEDIMLTEPKTEVKSNIKANTSQNTKTFDDVISGALNGLKSSNIVTDNSYDELEKLASFWYKVGDNEEFYSEDVLDNIGNVINKNYGNPNFLEGLGSLISFVEKESVGYTYELEEVASNSIFDKIISFFKPKEAHALISRPFGGRVIVAIPCTCTPGASIITIGPPTFGSYLYMIGISRLYRNYKVGIPTQWHLGNYRILPAICLVGVIPLCLPAPIPAQGIIGILGTS